PSTTLSPYTTLFRSHDLPHIELKMPPSQLKQLKNSLKEEGILGPQRSKKRKYWDKQHGSDNHKRTAALRNIREQFNPFEVKITTKPQKFEVTSSHSLEGKLPNGAKWRPGVRKGLGEETVSAPLRCFWH